MYIIFHHSFFIACDDALEIHTHTHKKTQSTSIALLPPFIEFYWVSRWKYKVTSLHFINESATINSSICDRPVSRGMWNYANKRWEKQQNENDNKLNTRYKWTCVQNLRFFDGKNRNVIYMNYVSFSFFHFRIKRWTIKVDFCLKIT